MKKDYALTKEDVYNEIDRCGYAIISASIRGYLPSRRLSFLLAKPFFSSNPNKMGYYHYGNKLRPSEVLVNYREDPSSPNCDVMWEDLLGTFEALTLEQLTLFDLVNK